MNGVRALTRFFCAAGFVFAAMCPMQGTRAAQVIFTFNCIIVDATTCDPASPLGSLTLTDSVVDPRRVDLDVTIYDSDGVGGLKYLYLNYDQSLPPGPVFGLLAQNAAPDILTPLSPVSQGVNNVGPAGTPWISSSIQRRLAC